MGFGIMKSPPKIISASASRALVATVAGTVSQAIPTLPDGSRARYLMISTNIQVLIAIGGSTVDAGVVGGVLIRPEGPPMIFDVSGQTHVSVNATGVGTCWLQALANQ